MFGIANKWHPTSVTVNDYPESRIWGLFHGGAGGVTVFCVEGNLGRLS